MNNTDLATVAGFGAEWSSYDQVPLSQDELDARFWSYFEGFPLDELRGAEGFDLGCGSGRWAALLAPRVGRLHCFDPAAEALAVARNKLGSHLNVDCAIAGDSDMPIADESQDFGYAIGVIHHTPDAQQALANCAAKLKPGAPFLVYLYYSFENRPAWFRAVWRATDLARRLISRLPFAPRKMVTGAIAALIYWPLARTARIAEIAGFRHYETIPLAGYRTWSFYSMRCDALDRFGTRIEHRFSRAEVGEMMRRAGLRDITFREGPPYWVAWGRKA